MTPKHGIKVQQIGATWWGKRWIESVEHLSRDSLSRLGRGRAYARAGHVQDLKIAPGLATALVTDADDELFRVSIKVAVLPAASWQRVIAAMSKQAIFVAELLSGRMPEKIDEAFRAAGHHLFIGKQRELEAECTCEDWVGPCKHVAAVHYVLGEAFDKDPFMLFEMRGRTRSQLLSALRALRSGQPQTNEKRAANPTRPSVTSSATPIISTESTPGASHVDDAKETDVAVAAIGEAIPPFAGDEFDRCPQPLPAFAVRIEPPSGSSTLLRQLGAPPGWNNSDLRFDELLRIYHRAAVAACELAAPELDGELDSRGKRVISKLKSEDEKSPRARRPK